MASSINASTTAGVVTTADTSGVLNIQTAGTTAIAISAGQIATFAQAPVLPAASIPQAALAVGVAGNGPAFSAYNSGNQTVTASVDTKVTLDTESFDTNNNFASSRFTPTVAGYYQFNGGVYCTSVSRVLAMLYKNGVIFCFGTDYVTSTGEQRSRVSTMVYLNGTTDYVELYVLPFGGTLVGAGIVNTFLSGFLARSA